jgi:hypothetical protein
MIKAFQTQQPIHRVPLNDGARKVFDEAAGVGMVPEVEDRYEDVAADFLEKWLVSSEDPFTPEPTQNAPKAPEQTPVKAEAQAPATPLFEPEMSTFTIGLDWQLSDGRKLG